MLSIFNPVYYVYQTIRIRFQTMSLCKAIGWFSQYRSWPPIG